MYAAVQLRVQPGGATARLLPGELVGRGLRAALPVLHPAVAEAHALVSLRDEGLVLLPARGALFVDGAAVSRERGVRLHEGLRVALTASGSVTVEVAGLHLDPEAAALCLDDGPPLTLRPDCLYRVAPGEVPWLRPDEGGEIAVFFAEGAWYVRVGARTAALDEEQAVELGGGHLLRLDCVPVLAPTSPPTSHRAPVELHAWPARVAVRGAGVPEDSPELGGRPGHCLARLARRPGPVRWEEVLPEGYRAQLGRNSADKNWAYLKRRIGEWFQRLGLPECRVRSLGEGRVRLVLGAADRLVLHGE